MIKSLSLALFLSLVYGALSVGCSEKPVQQRASASKASKADSKKGADSTKDNDLGEEDSDGSSDMEEEEGSDKDDKEVKTPSETETKPVDPKPEVPQPVVPDPAAEAKKLLLAACKPKSIKIIDNTQGVEGFQIFMGVFSDPAKELEEIAINDCVNMFKTEADVKAVKRNNLTIEISVDNHNGVANASPVPNTQVSTIRMSTNHIKNYKNQSAADRKREFYGVMSHEINHLYQNFSNGYTYYSEGLCDAIRADADYYDRGRKSKGDAGGLKWKGSYTWTGYFLRYMRKAKDPDFYYKFNKQMAKWDDSFWVQNYGRTVDQLWDEYQEKGFDPNDY